MAQPHGIVTFLSDYGLEDEFVGVCHGVMLCIAPQLKIVDVHHSILRQDIRHGAVVLEQSIAYLPDAVHLAVVDPTVGSKRRAVAVESDSGSIFVGPDNGLLLPAVTRSGGVARAFEIADERFMLTPVSHTFHGRDIFAPVTAHIAAGVELDEVGPELRAADLVQLEVPDAWVHDDHLHAEVLQLDRFGNLQMNFDHSQLDAIGLSDGSTIEIRMEGHRIHVPYGTSFSDVSDGDFVLVEDSYKKVSLAVNKGDAAARLQAHAGSTIIVGPAAR